MSTPVLPFANPNPPEHPVQVEQHAAPGILWLIVGPIVWAMAALATILRLTFVLDVLAIVLGLTVVSQLIRTYSSAGPYRASHAFATASMLTRTVADIIWIIVLHGYKQDPSTMPIFPVLYLLPNLLILAVVVFLLRSNFHHLDYVVLALDLIVITLISLFLFAGMMSRLTSLQAEQRIFLTTYSSIDLMILSLCMMTLSAMRRRRHRPGENVAIAAILLHIGADFLYLATGWGPTIYNPWIDLIILASFTLFGVVGWLEAHRSHPEDPDLSLQRSRAYNPRLSFNLIWMLGVFAAVLALLGLIDPIVVARVIVLIVVYQLVSSLVYRRLHSEQKLREQDAMRAELERLVQERTVALERVNNDLARQAIVDPLTGLYNRTYFIRTIDARIADGTQPFAVFFLDLDRFKVINDLHGHQMGDQVLIEITRRFQAANRTGSLIARIGGDEFGIIISDVDRERLSEAARGISNLFHEQVAVHDFRFTVGVSIGIARFPFVASTRDQLLMCADLAMYQAKHQSGPEKFVFYNSQLIARVERHNTLETLLHSSDYERAFVLYYQPIFRASDRKLAGAEALLRWIDPEQGSILPREFIPLAEETGQIIAITEWVIRRAMIQAGEWNRGRAQPIRMNINLSPVSINHIYFYDRLNALIAQLNVDPGWFQFEVTEHSSAQVSEEFKIAFRQLQEMGFAVAIDDFGTGYSSLSHLKDFDIDQLKIAKELIDGISSGDAERKIVQAIIVMARALDMKTLAEGVENEAQVRVLRQLQVDLIQGFFWGKPLPADEFARQFLIGP